MVLGLVIIYPGPLQRTLCKLVGGGFKFISSMACFVGTAQWKAEKEPPKAVRVLMLETMNMLLYKVDGIKVAIQETLR